MRTEYERDARFVAHREVLVRPALLQGRCRIQVSFFILSPPAYRCFQASARMPVLRKIDNFYRPLACADALIRLHRHTHEAPPPAVCPSPFLTALIEQFRMADLPAVSNSVRPISQAMCQWVLGLVRQGATDFGCCPEGDLVHDMSQA